ncbi:transposase [Desulfosarcina alkanivorans]|uniref:Transposase n=1 Tax=Desulfosarcina alkanivorans TaxID=571177 RepID=A0A5K7YQY4_9BACT|nr:transposase [Desulfosarcina alkanivorans]BBO72202.1 transposase [Desulfosarcina alkanivorans]
MPRQARIDTPGALHHIIARGIERRKIFNDDEDRDAFIERLGTILDQTGTECYAWALIPNHFHLLLRTGSAPIATVMRRLLTGHAICFNRRHRRSGHLFQNRYKSILCQEDAYLLELVRYIHLNPLRAKLVADMKALDKYPYCGHATVMGTIDCAWQNVTVVLRQFGKRVASARKGYRSFVEKGIANGKRTDLTGGGLIRSAGGWTAVKAIRAAATHEKSDERILGDGAFVERILAESQEVLDRRYALKAQGLTVEDVADRVAQVLGITTDRVWLPGKYKQQVMARSLLCFWSVQELGESMAAMAGRLGISTTAVSKSVRRGAHIADDLGVKLIS